MSNLTVSSANYRPENQEQIREPEASVVTAVAKRVFKDSPPPTPQMRAVAPRIEPPPFSLDALPELDLSLISPTSTKKSRPESRPTLSPEPICESTN